jgi:hypothetical protein
MNNGDISDWLVAKWLTDFTPAWFSLHIANPGRAGDIQTEVVGGSYQRMSGAFTSFDARTIWLATKLLWTGMPACILTYVGCWDNEYNGHLLSSGALPPPFPNVPQGGSFALDAHTFAVSVGLSS